MRGFFRNNWPDLLIFGFAIVIALIVFRSTACAEDAPLREPDPFKLACPAPLKCGTSAGYWMPHGYASRLAADAVRLVGCEKQATTYVGEIEANKDAIGAQQLRVKVLEEQLVLRDQNLNALTRARDSDRRMIEQRTRWAIVSTVAAVVLAGVVGATYYAAQH